MATINDEDDAEITFRRSDTGYNTAGLRAHSPLGSVRVANGTSDVSIAELEETLAAVNKRITELSAVRDSTFARRNLQSVFGETHGQNGHGRHVLHNVSVSDRHSIGLPLDRGTLSMPAATPIDRQLKVTPKVDRHSTTLRTEIDSLLSPTQHRTGTWTSATVATSPAVAQLTTVAETGSRGNIAPARDDRPTSRKLPKPPIREGVEDATTVNAAVASLSSSSRNVMETCLSESRQVEFEMLSASSRRVTPTIKLGSYDGVAIALETHLSKLDNCASYYNWSARDRLCHIKASLEGPAGQVLWEISYDATELDVVKLLRNRFGNVNQMERYRAELRSRRRKRGESIQAVYQDIRRLLALGFPGQSGELCEIIGRDAFLEALADPGLRIRVLDQSPSTLDEVLSIVCRMEAYGGKTLQHDDDGSEDQFAGRRKVRAVNAMPCLMMYMSSDWKKLLLHKVEKVNSCELTLRNSGVTWLKLSVCQLVVHSLIRHRVRGLIRRDHQRLLPTIRRIGRTDRHITIVNSRIRTCFRRK